MCVRRENRTARSPKSEAEVDRNGKVKTASSPYLCVVVISRKPGHMAKWNVFCKQMLFHNPAI
jgi:hypothetical protein